MRIVPFALTSLAVLSLGGAARAGTLTAVGNVQALNNIAQVIGIIGTGNFDEGPTIGSVPLNVYTPQGLTWISGSLSLALPGVTNTGTAFQPQYETGLDSSYFPAPIKGGGTHTGAYTYFAGVAKFSVLVTQVGLTASENGTQYLTVWDKNGTMLGQVTWTPAADSSFIGIDSQGVPIAMVAYGNHDVWAGQPYGVGGSTIIDDSWVWAAGTGSGKCFTNQQCDDANPCTTDTCDTTMGTCSYTNNTASCNTGDPCTMNDTCSGGVCVAGPSKPDGTSCPIGNLCMMTHTCMAGVCQASNPITCTALDSCHLAGVCDPSTGICNNPVKVDGTACNDNNLCTQTDTCKAGVCSGTSPVMCPAPDSCHMAGTCDMTSGMCVNPALPDGTACDDNNACTQTDSCMNGKCVGANPVDCTVKDQCHVQAMCDPTSGMCMNTAKMDGTACDDGNACTTPDTCQAGTCVGIKITCSAMDACHMAGTCDPMVGCSNPQAPDGTACPEGTCNAGVCVKSSGNGGGGTGGSTSASTSSSSGAHFPQKTGGCGCGLVPIEGAPAGGASASALLLAFALRRRRRVS
jgi:hypothetical protein